MPKTHRSLAVPIIPIVFFLLLAHLSALTPARARATAATTSTTRARLGHLPLRFEANQGQTDAAVKFLARGDGYALFLTDNTAVMKLTDATQTAAVTMRFLGVRQPTALTGEAPQSGVSHYFLGSDARSWQTDVPGFGQVKYQQLYPGIDVVWHGRQRQLEHDFQLAAGADPRRIRWRIEGAQRLKLNAAGDLLMETAAGTMRLLRPQAWQSQRGHRAVASRFKLLRGNVVTFALGAYDRRQPLVIDPVVTFARYVGGLGAEQPGGLALDHEGNIYLAGNTASTDFPGASAVQAAKAAGTDAFVMKLNPAGTAMIYGVWLGGAGNDAGGALQVDAAGNVYLTGTTSSADFPTRGAWQTALKGGSDAFVAKLDATGANLLQSTYLGGANSDFVSGVALDAAGNIYLGGTTLSADFPVMNPLQGEKAGSVVYTSTDGGENWMPRKTAFTPSTIYMLAVDPKNGQAMFAATDLGLFKTLDGGRTWNRRQVQAAQFVIRQVVIDPNNTNTLYLIDAIGSLYKSTDGAETVTPLEVFGVRQLALDPSNSTTLYAVVRLSNQLAKSTDGGLSWQTLPPVRPPFANALEIANVAVDPKNSMTVYAGTNYGVFKSTDGGQNFVYRSSGMPGNTIARFDQLKVSPANPSVLFAQFVGSLYRSTDGALSWRLIEPLPEIPLGDTLRFDPADENTIYALGFSGVRKSTDGGLTWRATNRGLPAQPTLALAFGGSSGRELYAMFANLSDGYLCKLNAAGNQLLFSTYVGGLNQDSISGIGLDAAGNLYFGGTSSSPDLPVVNAYQATLRGATNAMAGKLPAGLGRWAWLSYLGGTGADATAAVAVNAAGNLWLAGSTRSTDFPMLNAFQPVVPEPDEGVPNAFNAFVTRFNSDGARLDFSTYLGGTSTDYINGMALDANGNVHVTGTTGSKDFPGASNSQPCADAQFQTNDAFAAQLSADGRRLGYAQYLCGTAADFGVAIAIDKQGDIVVIGSTNSTNFPVTLEGSRLQGSTDVFLARLGLRTDLAVSLVDFPAPVQSNGTFSYLVTVANNGADSARSLTLTDTLPSGVTLLSVQADAGSCNNTNPVSCTLGDLFPGQVWKVTINVRASLVGTGVGSVTNRASVASLTTDSNAANNTVTRETRVTAAASIAGRVTNNDAGLSEVSVSLTGENRPAALTNAEGQYQFAELTTGGAFTVTPAKTGFVFTPATRAFNNLTSDQRADFAATACRYTLSASAMSFNAVGGRGSFTLNSPDTRCPWTVQTDAPWIKPDTPGGVGTSAISFTVAPTVGPRTATLNVNGNVFTVRQEYYACSTVEFANAPFLPLDNLSPGSGRPRMQARDFNGDGWTDLIYFTRRPPAIVVPPTFTANVTMRLSDGHGGMLAPINLLPELSSPADYIAVNAGDFNGDGRLDAAITISPGNTTAGRIALLLGDGTGKFAEPRDFTVAALPSSTVAADFNNDGRLDLVTVHRNSPTTAAILLNQGNGMFEAAKFLTLSATPNLSPHHIEAGDFNQDNQLDLAFISQSRGAFVARNLGNGNFAEPVSVTSSFVRPSGMALGDFNRDGKLDFAYTDQSELAYWVGKGDGSFETTPITVGNSNSTHLLAADLDEDGRLDFVTGESAHVNLYFAKGRGTFTPPVPLVPGLLPRGFAYELALVDFNRDGRRDLLTLGSTTLNTQLSPLGLNVLTGNGAGGFTAAQAYVTPPNVNSQAIAALALADLDGDGNQDVVMNSNGTLSVAPGDGRGGWLTPVSYPMNGFASELVLRDFNNDGFADVAVAIDAGDVTIRFNDGQGRLTTVKRLPAPGGFYRLAVADFNRDGRLDLAARGTTGVTLWLGAANGEFIASATGLAAAVASPTMAAGDFNGDGNADLAVFSGTPLCNGATPTNAVWLAGDGRGNFRAPQTIPRRWVASNVLVADLNADGRSDLIVAQACDLAQPRGLHVMLTQPQGGFAAPVRYGDGVGDAVLTDLNHDGFTDMAQLVASNRDLQVWLNRGDGSFVETSLPRTAVFEGTFAFGDVNHDGTNDLVALPRSIGRLTTLLNRAPCFPNDTAALASSASYALTRTAPESIASLFGANLATTTQVAATLPLPTTLANVSVKLRDSVGTEHLAPLFFVSPNQINLLIPAQAARGVALLTAMNGNAVTATATALISDTAPGLFSAAANGQGFAAALALRIRADGTQLYEAVAQFDPMRNRFAPLPIDVSDAREQVFLLLFGTGLRQRPARSTVTARVGELELQVPYAGAQGSLAGLDQVNLLLPASLQGRGETDLVLNVNGMASNIVRVSFK